MISGQNLAVLVEVLAQKFALPSQQISNDVSLFLSKILKFCSKTKLMGDRSNSQSYGQASKKSLNETWGGRPKEAHIDLTANCNFRCSHCYLGNLREKNFSYSLEQIKKIVTDLKKWEYLL